jgi:hypothetical protein
LINPWQAGTKFGIFTHFITQEKQLILWINIIDGSSYHIIILFGIKEEVVTYIAM